MELSLTSEEKRIKQLEKENKDLKIEIKVRTFYQIVTYVHTYIFKTKHIT